MTTGAEFGESIRKSREPLDISEVESELLELLPEAGLLAARAFNGMSAEATSKDGGLDFSTQADLDIDGFLIAGLKERFPQANFLTEETAAETADFEQFKTLENLFVIDPIDGTTNFSRGNPNFGISVALVDKGVTKAGAVHLPAMGTTFSARADRFGIKINGSPDGIEVSKTDSLKRAIVLMDMPHDKNLKPYVAQWISQLEGKVRRIGMEGSAVGDMIKLAEGQVDAFVHPGLLPWDVAAASLILEKAGAVITKSDGSPWDIFSPDMIASNPKLHQDLVDSLAAVNTTPGEQAAGDEIFEQKKRAYFTNIAGRVKDILVLHKQQGLWERDENGERDWGNVSTHCLVEAARVEIFADLFGFDEELKDDLIHAAALHDFYKKDEITKLRANGTSWEAYSEAQEEAKALMEQAGISQRVVWLATSVGHETVPEAETLLAKDGLTADEIAWLVMHYVDDYTVNDTWVEPAEQAEDGMIINAFDKRAQMNLDNAQPPEGDKPPGKYYGINQAGLKHFGELALEAQTRVGKLVEARLGKLFIEHAPYIILEDPIYLPEAIDEMLRQKIEIS